MSCWSEDLRHRFEEFEADAPEGLFDDIMEALPTQASAPREEVAPTVGEESVAKQQRGRVVPLWLQRVAVAAVVAIVAGAGVLTLRHQPDVREEQLLSSAIIEHQPATETLLADGAASALASKTVEQPTLLKTQMPKPSQIASKVVAKRATPQPAEQVVEPVEQMAEPVEPIEQSVEEQKPMQAAPAQNKTARRDEARQSAPASRKVYAVQPARTERASSGRLVANLFTSGFSGSRHGYASQQGFMVNSALLGETSGGVDVARGVNDDVLSYANDEGDMLLYDSSQRVNTDIHHHQPIRAGFSLRYALNDRWAVESGLQYALLSSDSSSGSTANYYEDRLSLHYIGLPLSAVFTLWESRRVQFYLTAGGLVEKCVSGSLRTDYVIGGVRERGQSVNTTVKELQFSVNAGAGLQLNLSPTVGIYAEPGVGYWFDNGSAIETIYRDRPLNFNLNLGLRFTL